MRFPWLQVDADFIAAHAGDLGSHLGISRREAIGLAVDLWTWALARAPDDAPPDGIVTGTGPVPDRLIAGSVGWTGPEALLIDALVACGLAVRIESGYRLTGFSRYKATWEKNRRRSAPKPERNRSGTGDKPERKTQTQTQTQKKEEDPPIPPTGGSAPSQRPLLAVSQPATPRPRKPPRAEPAGDPRHQPLVTALCEAAPGYVFLGGRDAKAVSQLLGLGEPEEVVRRWRIARAWQGFPLCRHLGDLVTNWNAYLKPQGPPGVRPGRMDTTPSDFSKPPEGEGWTDLEEFTLPGSTP